MNSPALQADMPVQPPVQAAQPANKQPPLSLILAIIVAATALPFLPALRYGFVFDDDVQVVQNIAVRSTQSPLTYFVTSIWTLRNSAIPLNYNYYRPLFHTWLRLNAALFGYNVIWWHLAALLTHLAVTVLVFFLIQHHVRKAPAAMIGALIFGVHPVHIESVVWISGATDPLMTLGTLASFVLWLKLQETGRERLWVGSLLCYAGALLCKETAIALPVIVFVYVLRGITTNESKDEGAAEDITQRARHAIREALPFLGVTLLYFGARTAVLHGFRAGSRAWLSRSQALLTAPSVLLFYLRQLVWPVALRLFYDFRVVSSPRDPRFWLTSLAFLAAASGLLFWSRRHDDRALLASAAWLLVPLAPVLNIGFFYRDDFVHDRYAYLPSVGLAILCGLVAKRIFAATPSRWRRLPAIVGMTLAIAALAGLALTESTPWQNNLSLYSHAAQSSTNTMAQINLASEYATRGRLDEAKSLLEPVVQERPDFWLANYNLGYVDYRLKDLDTAERFLDRAITLNPKESDAYLYRGLVCLRKGQPEEARALLRRAIALNPRGEGYHFALGTMLIHDNPDAAESEFREELKYHPSNGLAKIQLENLEKTKSPKEPSAPPKASEKIN